MSSIIFNSEVQLVSTSKLKENNYSKLIYKSDKDFDFFKDTIQIEGVLTPLIVNMNNEVISGVRRLRAALSLGIDELPVIYSNISDSDVQRLIVIQNQQRQKTDVELYEEYKILTNLYGVKKGTRTDLIPEICEAKKSLLSRMSKSKMETYDEVFRLAETLSNSEEEKKQLLEPLYKKVKVSTLRNQLRTKVNQRSFRTLRNIASQQGTNVQLIQSTCEGAVGVEKESVQCIVTSPPYPNSLRDYGLGPNQLGAEKTVQEYVANLVSIFKSVKHTLKPSAKVFVNLMDSMEDGVYWNSVERFIIAMVDEGFHVADRIVWVKNNPNQTTSSCSNISHEHIICFTLEKNPKFHKLTSEDGVDFESNSVAFNNGNRTKSFWNIGSKTIETNTNSFSKLKRKCEQRGVNCNHSAGFPVIIPELCIRLATEPGDTVMDIFSGTATTGEAALSKGRNYIGFEALPDFHEVAKVRLEDYLFKVDDNPDYDQEEYLEAA